MSLPYEKVLGHALVCCVATPFEFDTYLNNSSVPPLTASVHLAAG